MIYMSAEMKAGAWAGILWSIFIQVDYNEILPTIPEIRELLASNPQTYFALRGMILVGTIVMGASFGLLVGVVFIRARSWIPGHYVIVQAILLSIALWLPLAALAALDGDLALNVGSYLRQLIANISAGILFSYLFQRWSGRMVATTNQS